MRTTVPGRKARREVRFVCVFRVLVALSGICAAHSGFTQTEDAPSTVQATPLLASGVIEQIPEGVPRSWLSEAVASIAASEYEIRYQEGPSAYQAPNRVQNLRFSFLDAGFVVAPRTNDVESMPWQAAIWLEGYGRQQALRMPNALSWTVEGRIANAVSSDLSIEYVNDRTGMRQTFVIQTKPSGTGLLLLLLHAELDGLDMAVDAGENLVGFARQFGDDPPILFYSDLNVWDATGRSVEASFQPITSDRFGIVVDDSFARYPLVIDPLTHTGTRQEDQATAAYGISVASAGDVNGDGYSDVIVGATRFDNGQADEGKVFVYHGSSSGLGTSASWTAESNLASANMGNSVASAGDVNGDGYSDIIVGAQRYYISPYQYEGAAFVWFGSSSGLGASGTPGNADWAKYSTQVADKFGFAVACAGDVNGDGYSDILVSSYYHSSYYYTADGAVWAYLGSASGPSSTAHRTYYGSQSYAYFGYSVAGAGDVNADGYSDVIIAAPYYDAGQTDEGRVFVYHGSSTGLSASANWTAESNQANACMGLGPTDLWGTGAVSSAGDVNGDGYSDIIVGARNYWDSHGGEGYAFVWYGDSGGLGANGTPSNADWKAESNQASAYFGESVASAGDVNGDGYADVIVGAPRYDNGQTDEGLAFVWLGSASGLGSDGTPNNANWIGEMNQASARFGMSVACAGDVDGNGYSDVIVGAPYYDDGQSDEGAAFLFQGSSDGLAAGWAWATVAGQNAAQLGWSVSSAGDINGDGYSDIIIAAPYYDAGQNDEGAVFVYHGSTSGPLGSPNWTAQSDQEGAALGYSVVAAGDVNGDGYGDILVGSPGYSNGQASEGRAFVWHGSSSGLGSNGTPGNADWKAESDEANALLGFSVASADDVNGDGYGDIIVGAPFAANGQATEGRIFVWHGSSTGLGSDGTSANADWKAESNQSSSQFGISVACAGDVNRDGYSDVIVGANLYDNGQNDEGRVFVWHGSSTGLGSDGTPANADWSADGNLAGGDFGWSVASAGDVNGDGYSDVIVGAPLYDSGAAPLDVGTVFVWHGGSGGLSTGGAATGISGSQAGQHLGICVASAGDVNGDGLSDVIYGADSWDGSFSDEGSALVHHGSASGVSTTAAWGIQGGQQGAALGRSVAAAGDVNGDGYGDVIIGANLYHSSFTDEGLALVYFGNSGDGLDFRPRQWQPNLSTPVTAPLRTGSTSQVGLGITGRTFYGRGDVKVQYEVKALGTAFNGSSLSETASWTDTGTGGAAIATTIGSLSNNTFYKWRARIKYRLSDGAIQPFSRWYFIPDNGPTESDFQVRN